MLEFGLQFLHAFEQCRVVAVFIGKFARELVVLVQQRGLRAETGGNGIEYRSVRIEFRLLRHQRELQFRLAPDLAVVERNFTADDFEQARLARAVAADQADALAALDHQIGMVEQRDVAECEASAIESC